VNAFAKVSDIVFERPWTIPVPGMFNAFGMKVLHRRTTGALGIVADGRDALCGVQLKRNVRSGKGDTLKGELITANCPHLRGQ
jgi:hypothetical protein